MSRDGHFQFILKGETSSPQTDQFGEGPGGQLLRALVHVKPRRCTRDENFLLHGLMASLFTHTQVWGFLNEFASSRTKQHSDVV